MKILDVVKISLDANGEGTETAEFKEKWSPLFYDGKGLCIIRQADEVFVRLVQTPFDLHKYVVLDPGKYTFEVSGGEANSIVHVLVLQIVRGNK